MRSTRPSSTLDLKMLLLHTNSLHDDGAPFVIIRRMPAVRFLSRATIAAFSVSISSQLPTRQNACCFLFSPDFCGALMKCYSILRVLSARLRPDFQRSHTRAQTSSAPSRFNGDSKGKARFRAAFTSYNTGAGVRPYYGSLPAPLPTRR